MGMMLQHAGLIEDLSVFETLKLWSSLTTRTDDAEELLDRIELAHRRDTRVEQHSSAHIGGARATFISDGEFFHLYDTACDGSRVYLVYRLRGGSQIRHNFNDGCNRSITYNKAFDEGSRVDHKACVDLKVGLDKCSAWRTDWA